MLAFIVTIEFRRSSHFGFPCDHRSRSEGADTLAIHVTVLVTRSWHLGFQGHKELVFWLSL